MYIKFEIRSHFGLKIVATTPTVVEEATTNWLDEFDYSLP